MPKWNTPKRKYADEDPESSITELQITNKDQSGPSITANRLYFYGDINDDTVLGWNRQLDDVSKNMKVIQTMYDLPAPPPIHIYIQSYGGEVFAALATLGRISHLVKTGFEVHTVVEGFCASAATLISVGGSRRFMRPYSCMMIHQLSSGFWGTYAEMKDEQKNVDLMMNIIRSVYNKHTHLGLKDLDDILTHDLYLSPEECIQKGLTDEVL